jgi:hypothetical protein
MKGPIIAGIAFEDAQPGLPGVGLAAEFEEAIGHGEEVADFHLAGGFDFLADIECVEEFAIPKAGFEFGLKRLDAGCIGIGVHGRAYRRDRRGGETIDGGPTRIRTWDLPVMSRRL